MASQPGLFSELQAKDELVLKGVDGVPKDDLSLSSGYTHMVFIYKN